ncbi:MAG: hypothetical protein QM820_50805 [Minicystis sp.]
MSQLLRRGRVLRRAVQLTAATLAIAGTGAVSGCLTRPLQGADTRTTSTVVTRLQESAVDKIDLLLMIDNSRSMADKQQILVAAVPDLVRGLVNPKCVDPTTPEDSSKWVTPAGPLDMCPTGLKRDFNPIVDIHIGIVSSSIGGHGSDACPNTETFSCAGAATNTTNNDMGHLITRLDPCTGGNVGDYQGKGFLAWDPTGKKNDPPGEANIGSINIDPNTGVVTTGMPGLVPSLKDMVLGTGQIGCGYESQHESWYRFLIDPEPYSSITVDPATLRANQAGIDDTLLQQRRDFLRPSSLLAIIGLTDENDCSIKEYGQFWFAAQQRDPNNSNKNFYLPKARSECATNPNDKCCRSCGQDQTGCPPDPNCTGTLDAKTDDVNLRCWDQKRRFGIDFLYPIDRYTTGLTLPLVPNRVGDMVPNPIFSDLNTSDTDSNIRDSSLVFLAYIVGVPWQDIAKDPTDLKKGFKTSTELAKADAQGHSTWDYIIGDPANYVPPLDPHMIESTSARMGTNPFTGDTISPPTNMAGMGADKINGHEYTPGTKDGVQAVADDLQYACIFDLPQPRDCATDVVSCDCSDPKNDNPLCEPADPTNPTTTRTKQVRAKAYPGTRELTLIKALGTQGIVGSICPKQLTDVDGADFGYRPAIGAIIDRLKLALGGQCLPRKLTPDNEGQVQCLILEARNTGGLHKDDCDAFCDGMTSESLVARQHVQDDHKPAVEAAKADPIASSQNWDCFCEIKQLNNGPKNDAGKDTDGSDDYLNACQQDPAEPPLLNSKQVDGWCYIDATSAPVVGNAEIVKNCPATEKRLVRFVGNGNPQPGSTLFITCAGE